MEERIDVGKCNKKTVGELGDTYCDGRLIAVEKMPLDMRSLKYAVQCSSCKRWWETNSPLRLMKRFSKKM